jgi:hypothetical protein
MHEITITNNKSFKNLLLLISNMSGQPNRYSTSAEKFRNQYMEALNGRANVDDYNLQANKNYKATGSLPPKVMQMMDNRTTTEILADTEKLKLNIINELKQVMTTSTASVVVQKIQTAPVNVDGSFLIWTAQNMPEIVKNLKKKYALGIKGDTQDAENIVIFLSGMFSKVKAYTGTVKSYFDTAGESKVGIREGDLDAISKEYMNVMARIITKYNNMGTNTELLAVELRDKINELLTKLTSIEYKEVIYALNNLDVNDPNPPDLTYTDRMIDNGKLFFEIVDKLPSAQELKTLLSQLTKSMNNDTPELTDKILITMIDLFPSVEEYTQMDDIIDDVSSSSSSSGPPSGPPSGPASGPVSARSSSSSSLSSSLGPQSGYASTISSVDDDEAKLQAYQSTIQDRLSEIELEREDVDQQITALGSRPTTTIGAKKWDKKASELDMKIHNLDKETKELQIKLQSNVLPTRRSIDSSSNVVLTQFQTAQANVDKLTLMIQTKQKELEKAQKELKNIPISSRFLSNAYPSKEREIERIERDIKQLDDSLKQNEETVREIQRHSVSLDRQPGVGLGFKKRRGRPKGSGIGPRPFMDKIDERKGIQPVKKYHPFGKYFVNAHKLNHGNILSIKSKSGTNIREYPSKTVSPHLGHVIKTIIGGGVPSWNDMDRLSEDEKDYLYKISKRAEFTDKISIPTPSKDKMEKDIHEFEVCKGEIMAGNDSKELVKKFKLLIIKLSKNGTIPKREASEVMTELLELGY